MNFSRTLFAAALVAAGMGAAASAASAQETEPRADVDVLLRSNGSLDIIGDQGPNSVDLCPIGDGSFVVKLGTDEMTVEVTNDIRVNLKGGGDILNIDPFSCETVTVLGEPAGADFPRDLRVVLGSGDDDLVSISNTSIADDVLILGGSGLDNVFLFSVTVGDRLDINTSSGPSSVVVDDVSARKTSIRGGQQTDIASINGSDLGSAPRIFTNAGVDGVQIVSTVFSGRFTLNTGAGDDQVAVVAPREVGPCEDCPPVTNLFEDGYLNLIMGGGDDQARIDADLTARDRLQGGAGREDTLFYEGLDDGAKINGFELFELPPPQA